MSDARVEHINLQDAKGRLEELVERAASGEVIVIERNDGSAARLERQAPAIHRAPYAWGEHMKWLEDRPLDPRDTTELDRELRSLDRY